MPNQGGITVPAASPVAGYPLVNGVDVLAGMQSVTATTGATTIITIPAGRIWSGYVGASCACNNAGAAATQAIARSVISITGAGAIPAAGNYLAVTAMAGANVAAGTVGSEGSNFGQAFWMVVAPAANAVTIQATTTVTGTAGDIDTFAYGQLQ